VSPGIRGVPDQIVFLGRLVAFVEVKSPTGKLSSAQVREIHRMEDLGAWVFVVSNEEEVDACIKEIML